MGLTFAPQGDQGIWQTLENAISKASQFIYIEDQYFTNEHVFHAIYQALVRGLNFFVLVMPRKTLGWDLTAPDPTVIDSDPAKMAMALFSDFPHKVRICYLEHEKEWIYVHSKTQIVDDIFLSCGSANLDIRGLGVDLNQATSQECNLICIDEVVTAEGSRRLPQYVRARLWAEHLGLNPDNPVLLDPVAAYIKYWERSEPMHHVRFWTPKQQD
ncbi:MAG: hypothetical protein IPG76_00135 [Acidobacteria bacterium]|nr:hypothetical protein [Acidobacteriota bacterium]